jgi:hypothetical protein
LLEKHAKLVFKSKKVNKSGLNRKISRQNHFFEGKNTNSHHQKIKESTESLRP